jgi:hypothetical protein
MVLTTSTVDELNRVAFALPGFSLEDAMAKAKREELDEVERRKRQVGPGVEAVGGRRKVGIAP